jgi:enoyl-CoA hydratase/carnithine racemase
MGDEQRTIIKAFKGETLSWEICESVIELAMHHPPANEFGGAMIPEMEQFIGTLESASSEAKVLIIYSQLKSGFSAGGDLREMYTQLQRVSPGDRAVRIRDSIERNHHKLNVIDASPLITIAAVNGVCFGGGFELALACDLILADTMARFCFPELRLGLIPAGGGIPRLKRDVGNSLVRDLLLTGRSINARRAQSAGLVSQVAAEGQVLQVARSTAAQIRKFDSAVLSAAKKFIKPIPYDELSREVEIASDLVARNAVVEGLRKFIENTDVFPYLP